MHGEERKAGQSSQAGYVIYVPILLPPGRVEFIYGALLEKQSSNCKKKLKNKNKKNKTKQSNTKSSNCITIAIFMEKHLEGALL